MQIMGKLNPFHSNNNENTYFVIGCNKIHKFEQTENCINHNNYHTALFIIPHAKKKQDPISQII